MDDNLNLNTSGDTQPVGQPAQPSQFPQNTGYYSTSEGAYQPTQQMPQSDQFASAQSSQPATTQAFQSAPQPSGQPTQEYAPPTGVPIGASAQHYQAASVGAANAAEQTVRPVSTGSQGAAAADKGASGGKTFLIAFAGALVACVLALGVALGFGILKTGSSVNLGATSATSIEAVSEEVSLAEAVANKCLPSVVSIDVFATKAASSGSIYEYLYGNNSNSGELTETGLGSGVILSDDGYIITNNHVISGGERFIVTIEGETYEADLVGTEASSDVAVLKVKNGNGFTPIELGDSDNIKIGEWVMSLGSPFGLEQSVATGIVSATSRSQIMDSSNSSSMSSGEVVIYPNMIQTDAAINPGNSGGALVNAQGQLIGVNTLITSYSGNYSGVGFAIPVNYAVNLAQSIIAGEEPTHAQLGITMTTVNAQIAQRYGFSVKEGAYISSVAEGTAAEKAGLKVGDIITAFDGQKVSSASDVMLDVRTKNPGDTVTVTINREGESQDVQVTLGESTSNRTTVPTTPQDNSGNGSGNGQNPLRDFFNR